MSTPEEITHDEALREQGVQLVTRLVALLRTGRSYSIGNQVFTGQLEQLLEVLRPTLMAHGRAQLVHLDGDLYLNGVRLPLKSSSVRFQDQLHSELALRDISGVEFHASLRLNELEEFMRYFLPSELYKGTELLSACQAAGIQGAMPVLSAVADGVEHASSGDADANPAFAAALQAYDAAIQQTRILLAPEQLARGIELRYLKRIVQPLADAAASEEPAIIGVAWTSAEDAAWVHAVHVCLVSLGMGQRIGLDRRELADVGVAALLHDIGQYALVDVPADADARDGMAMAALTRHPITGVEAIARCTPLHRTSLRAMRVALEHHACLPGGYPVAGIPDRPSPASRLVAVADAFISLLSLKSESGRRITPYEALGHVLGPVGGAFEPLLRQALVAAVGVYPPGQVVALDDQSLARALAPCSNDPERPIIELLSTPQGHLLEPHARVVMPLPQARSIARALPIDEWPDFSSDTAAA